MKFSSQITTAALVSLVTAAAQNLEVSLSQSGQAVKATIKNPGSSPLKLLSFGNLLDEADPVEKFQVSQKDSSVAFQGLRIYPAINSLTASNFRTLEAGQTITIDVDPSELHDLSPGGAYDLIAQGSIQLADLNSTTLNGQAVSYKSNVLTIDVDAAHARRSFKTTLNKRVIVDGNCSPEDGQGIRDTFGPCQNYANGAAAAARTGDAGKFNEYFKVTDQATRDRVAGVFDNMAANCASEGTEPSIGCVDNDPSQPCSNGAAAYAYPGGPIVVCAGWFEGPTESGQCHVPDRTSTVIHELSHISSIFGEPVAADVVYGYDASVQLSAEDAIRNADSYTYFANAIAVGNGC